MKIFIPTVGTTFKLKKDWSFTLYHEYRNETLLEINNIVRKEEKYSKKLYDWVLAETPMVLPKDTELKVDRIYIRKGKNEFDSITFILKGAKTKPRTVKRKGVSIDLVPGTGPVNFKDVLLGKTPYPKTVQEEFEYDYKIPAKPVRFWAKLEDVNTMEVDIIEE